MSSDITHYCNRKCVNYKCRRNIAHLPETDYAYYGVFENCEEYIEELKEQEVK